MSETMAAPENPAAFPMTGEGFGSNHYNTWQAGMTLRDYFAGQAITGWLACPTTEGNWAFAAKEAYAIADALLAARSTK
jgi:hypothetical protein